MSRTVLPARPLAASLAVLVLAGGLAACSSSGGGSGAPSDSSSGSGSAPAGDPHTANVTINAASGCTPDATTYAAGGITFKITNKDATAVTEIELLDGKRIVGEKENLPPGLSGEFAVQVDAGTYTLYCPGAPTENTTITVTGQAPSTGNEDVAALLKTATANYAEYVTTQVGYLLDTSQKLATALHGTDLAAAQKAYVTARPFYEKIEPVAESFTVGNDSLDADIDARDGDVPAAQWKGFHKIEKALYATKSPDGLSALGDQLVTNVKKLQGLTQGLTYQATELANGAQELLDEVASSKITGEEERYSHIDVLDMAYNVEGSEQAFAQLQPALAKIDSALTDQINNAFTALDTEIAKFRTTDNDSGYVLYATLTAADKKDIAAAVKAVQEPLSKVASKVANA
ncbi:MAG TPA: iron uptake system protein EfeO [Jatrophihabitans sp.]|jgi:iron uptake system component EfeO